MCTGNRSPPVTINFQIVKSRELTRLCHSADVANYILQCSILYALLVPDHGQLSALIIDMQDQLHWAGGEQPLVAKAHAPVC